jgi:TolB-like protein
MRPGIAVSFSAILLLLLAGYAALNYEKWLPAGEEKSIVVMPFRYAGPSEDKEGEFLAEGFHTEIINRLQFQKGLLAIAPASARQAADRKLATADYR